MIEGNKGAGSPDVYESNRSLWSKS
jgi:hypothetical protein